jgi:hypothetical protein
MAAVQSTAFPFAAMLPSLGFGIGPEPELEPELEPGPGLEL